MDFGLKDLEILDSPANLSSFEQPHSNTQPTSSLTANNSLILNEIHKENEELQNKLKLNYRRLLLFETENNKLIEEKNKFFFEMKNYSEQNKIFAEKNQQLENENTALENTLHLQKEKIEALDKINNSQLSEIKRFSKFHLKIQNTVKPYIIQLKKQVQQLQSELTGLTWAHQSLETERNSLFKKLQNNQAFHSAEVDKLNNEKQEIILAYEQQIQSLSQEILTLQTQNEDSHKEISRLKKAVEFKNYFENELIKFKRIHEEDQQKIHNLQQMKATAETQILQKSEELAQTQIRNSQMALDLDEKNTMLDVTRRQLTQQLDQNVVLNERLNRLEKLNNQLSREMSQLS